MKPLTPKNGGEVLSLFLKHYRKLGFSNISHISGCDILAKRKGKPVNVRVELSLKNFHNKYIVDPGWFHLIEYRWFKVGDHWVLKMPNGDPLPQGDVSEHIQDPNNEYVLDDLGKHLIRKTLRDRYNYVVCWLCNCKIEKGIKVINLQRFLTIYRKSRKHQNTSTLKHPVKESGGFDTEKPNTIEP